MNEALKISERQPKQRFFILFYQHVPETLEEHYAPGYTTLSTTDVHFSLTEAVSMAKEQLLEKYGKVHVVIPTGFQELSKKDYMDLIVDHPTLGE